MTLLLVSGAWREPEHTPNQVDHQRTIAARAALVHENCKFDRAVIDRLDATALC